MPSVVFVGYLCSVCVVRMVVVMIVVVVHLFSPSPIAPISDINTDVSDDGDWASRRLIILFDLYHVLIFCLEWNSDLS